jgi:hypothetical protein
MRADRGPVILHRLLLVRTQRDHAGSGEARTVGGLGGSAPQHHHGSDLACAFRRQGTPRASATQTGLEPATFAVTGRRANQLRHWALL